MSKKSLLCEEVFLKKILKLTIIMLSIIVMSNNIVYASSATYYNANITETRSYLDNLSNEDKEYLSEMVEKTVREIEELNNIAINQYEMQSLTEAFDKSNIVRSSSYTTDRIAFIYRTNTGHAKNIKREYDSIVSTRGLAAGEYYRNETFINLVKTGGPWDLKGSLGTNNTYKLLGHTRTGEYIGNHHFGYMGRHIGFNLTYLKIGAGLYQIYSGTSKFSYIFSFFDDPADQAAIDSGYYAWNNF